MHQARASLLPLGGAELVSCEGGQNEATVVLEVDAGVAWIACEAAHHVPYVREVLPQHTSAENMSLNPLCSRSAASKIFAYVADLVHLPGPPDVQCKAVDAESLRLFDLTLIAGDFGFIGAGD